MKIRFHFTLFFFFLLNAGAVEAQSNKDKASNNAKQALIFEDNGKTDEAVKLLEESVKLDPANINYNYELAYALYTKGEYEKARSLLEKIMNSNDIFASAYGLLGNTFDKLGNRELAVETYGNGLKKFPNSGALYLELGNMHLGRKDYEKALGQYEKGIEADPAFPSNYYWAAKIYCNSDETVWGMLYGEIFLNLERNTKRTDEISRLLYDTYRKKIRVPKDSSISVVFSPVRASNTISVNEIGKKKQPFAKSVYEPTLMLGMLNEKSVDMASLSRARKYFIESYMKYGRYLDYPNVLFDFQYRALKAGYFDAYSHWVLCKGDENACNEWIRANRKNWDDFMKWFRGNKLLLDQKYKFYRGQY